MKKTCFFFLFIAIASTASYAQTASAPSVADTTNPGIDIPAKFPGGTGGWKIYLERNLDANVTIKDKAPAGNYPVKVRFMVDKEGDVTDVTAVSTPAACPHCGDEAVRVIKTGPRWIPAIKAGRRVDYKATQLITFQVAKDALPYGLIPVGPPLVPFRDITLSKAIQEAGTAGKMVFAQFIVKGCNRCNETADIAFASKSLAAAVADRFTPIKIDINSPDRAEFMRKYNPSGALGTFFIGADGELLYHYARTSSRPDDYLVELDKAYSKQTEGRVTLKELDEEWKANPLNFSAMELNLERRQSFGWKTDGLLDLYIKRLPVDSMKSVRTLTFIAGMAPSLFSPANTVLRRDNDLFNRLWFTLPETKRKEINQRVITKSLNTAITFKNKLMAETVADFTKKTYAGEPAEKGEQGYDRQMMNFFRGVKDTATYLQKAVSYYDRYYMSVDVEDVTRTDSINRRLALDTAKLVQVEDPRNKGRFINRRMITVVPQGSMVAAELIQGAQSIYTLSNDKDYLQKAVAWATRAKELYPFADMDGVLPKILYTQGDKAAAIALQKETINKQQPFRGRREDLQAILELMEADKKLADRPGY